MSAIVLAGFSNSGKSTSLRFLPPKETFIFNVNNKQLAIPGFKKNYRKLTKEVVFDENGKPIIIKKNGKDIEKKVWVGNYYQSDDYEKANKVISIVNTLKYIHYFVIDDINYLLGQDTMSMATVSSYDKYSKFAYNYNSIIHSLMNMREDIQVIITSHLMKDEDSGYIRMISNSRLLDKSINLDGLFNYIIYAEKLVDELNDTVKYVFRTRTLGNDTCRSTYGCFKDLYIKPDIKACIDHINAFEAGDIEPEYYDDEDILPATKKEEKPKDDKPEKDEKNVNVDGDDLEI